MCSVLTGFLRSPTIAAVLLVAGLALVLNASPTQSTVYKWSQTATSNATADSTINWAEGMAPSAVNDSARFMMAALAKWRDDLTGATQTGGSSNNYTLATNQGFSSLSAIHGARVCFKAGFTNTSSATINVDTLGAKALRAASGVELSAGALVFGTPYCAVYDNSSSEWIVTFVNANTTIPLGGMIDFIGGTAPSSNFVVPRGQCLSRTTYAALFSLVSTTYNTGACTGSEFGIPDIGGRVVAGTEALATRLTSGGSGCTGTALGSVCGAELVNLAANNIPTLSTGNFGHSLALSNATITNGTDVIRGGSDIVVQQSGAFHVWAATTKENLSINGAVSGSITYTNSSLQGVNKQPATIVLNKLLRVL